MEAFFLVPNMFPLKVKMLITLAWRSDVVRLFWWVVSFVVLNWNNEHWWIKHESQWVKVIGQIHYKQSDAQRKWCQCYLTLCPSHPLHPYTVDFLYDVWFNNIWSSRNTPKTVFQDDFMLCGFLQKATHKPRGVSSFFPLSAVSAPHSQLRWHHIAFLCKQVQLDFTWQAGKNSISVQVCVCVCEDLCLWLGIASMQPLF